MTLSSKRVLIEISPSRLEVALVRAGAIGESRSLRFPRTDWPGGAGQFAEALEELANPLQQMVTALDCAGAAASVVYLAPGAITNVTSCPVPAGVANAEQAARLAIANTADFVLDGSPCDTFTILTERVNKDEATHVPQNHVLASADAEVRVAAIAGLCKGAGLLVDRLLPLDALAFAQAARIVTSPETTSLRAALWIGEHSSVLAVGMTGKLTFVRSVSAGMESLVEALTRPIKPANETAEPITLSREQARGVLGAIGIPAPDQPVPGHPEVAGSALLPHLQPVLQRLAIEIKQSLRFGIPESQRGKVSLQVAGPGAHVPNIGSVMSRLAGVPDSPTAPGDEAMNSPLATLLARRELPVNLLPADLRGIAIARRLRSALVAGAALTAGLIAFEYGSTWMALSKESTRLSQLQAQHDAVASAAASRDAVLSARAALSVLEERIRTRLGDRPDGPAALSLLAQETPTTMRLTEIAMGTESPAGDLTVRGYIRSADASDPAGVINRYIATLASIPAVKEARLGPTLRGTMRGGDAQNFEVRLELVGVPPNTVVPMAGGGSAKEAP